MIELLTDVPEGVTGIRVSGRLSGEELRAVKPAIAEQLKSGKEIRIVEVIEDYSGFGPGGLMEDLKLGLGTVLPHHSSFTRIAIVTDKDPEGLEIIRHSSAHLLAYAVKTLFPDAQVTIGPVIEDGFYYDFSYQRPFTPDDLAAIEAKMAELAKKDERIAEDWMTW